MKRGFSFLCHIREFKQSDTKPPLREPVAGCGESKIRWADILGSHLPVGPGLGFLATVSLSLNKMYFPQFPPPLGSCAMSRCLELPTTCHCRAWWVQGQLSHLMMSGSTAGIYFLEFLWSWGLWFLSSALGHLWIVPRTFVLAETLGISSQLEGRLTEVGREE